LYKFGVLCPATPTFSHRQRQAANTLNETRDKAAETNLITLKQRTTENRTEAEKYFFSFFLHLNKKNESV